jgi:uncharacterized cupin superfamily protein
LRLGLTYAPGVRRFNLLSAEVEYEEGDPEAYHAGFVRLGPQLGGAMLGATLYELPPGQSNCPYHYEYGNEEWLVVIDGRPTLRHPEGDDDLDPGDVVCFPVGPNGAHKVTNRTDATARFLMLSTQHEPAVAVYPDSDKIGLWPGDRRDNIVVTRESGVDYWEREA